MLTSIATVGATAAQTALRPTLGKLDAYLKDSRTLTYCVPNEYICAQIGSYLGLPIPPCGLVYKQGHNPEHYFASLNFNLTNTQLPPIDPRACVVGHGFDAAGILLFDILICNCDRHRHNLSLDSLANPPRLTVFDHSHALFGHTNGAGRARLIDLRDKLGIIDPGGHRHCLLDTIATDSFFKEWIDRIRGLPNYLIDSACDATVPLNMINGAEASEAKTFLNHRKGQIETIIKANKSEFTSIPQWSLV
jgi:hypothetical protein